ncbi:unnamed protein product [Toxocara canis]|uniref:CaMBD domain-containing protein n=1 Tax=Toxocara canis TaxID=6265 RepID=A0A183V202_TOXCA|nr:unnamed protein product [Toxocara canis]
MPIVDATNHQRNTRIVPFPLRRDRSAHEERETLTTTRRNGNGGAGYGVMFTSAETIHKRYKWRRKMLDLKMKVSDWCLYLALFGLVLAVIDAELVALSTRNNEILVRSPLSFILTLVLRIVVLASTLLLDVLILVYHSIEVKISLIEMGSDYWRIGVTCERIMKLLIELTICSICPVPGVGTVEWPILGVSERYPHTVHIPIDVLLCLPMFLRLYIACRYFVLHSIQFKDPATKAMASLNQISVDFPFVVKSQLTDRPLSIIAFSTVCFWLILAWMLTQCESTRHIIDFIWFEVVTFFSIGYGDVQVQTYCGRALAIITGIVGTLMSSLLIALVGHRMQLSLSERRVNQVIAESQLSSQYKHSAARVLQCTWRALRQKRLMNVEVGIEQRRAQLKFRDEQRKLMRAITGFRRARWKLRMRLEYEDDFIAFRRSFVETQDRLATVCRRQQHLRAQLNLLSLNVDKLSLMLSPNM